MKKFIKIINTVCTMLIVANCCTTFGMDSNLSVMPSNNKESNAGNTVVIADPAYDSTFKYIFGDSTSDLEGSRSRLMSLLNAVFYPNTTNADKKIKTLEFLTNNTCLGSVDGTGALNFDIACKCIVYAGIVVPEHLKPDNQYSFDVEIQTSGSGIDLYPRLLQYGHAMRPSCDYPVKVLAFFNPQPSVLSAHCNVMLKTSAYDIETQKFIKEVNNNMDVFVLDLRTIAQKLQNKQGVKIKGTKLGKDAEDWLSLLSIRQWGEKGLGNGSYKIPIADHIPEVQNAIELLSNVTSDDLKSAINRENAANNLLKSAEQKGIQEGIKRGKVSNNWSIYKKACLNPKINIDDLIPNESDVSDNDMESLANSVLDADSTANEQQKNSYINFIKNNDGKLPNPISGLSNVK